MDGTWKFQGRPRALKDPPEQDVSLILGRMDPVTARKTAYGALTRFRPGRDAVRHVQAGSLRSVGFRVEHTPRHGGSLLHVSVFRDGTSDWDDTVEDSLHSCCMGGEV